MSKPEHGTVRSYVIGFVLSLVFTLVPYFMVVNKTATGTVLLGAILAFAVVQLIIQVVFFLHLGRERKPRFNLYFLIATVGAIMVVVGGSIVITTHLHYNMSPTYVEDKISDDEAVHEINGAKTGTCSGTRTVHKVEIKNNQVSPKLVKAHQCDRLMIINHDEVVREIAFGAHDHHGDYAGNTGKTVAPQRNLTITLTALGEYHFHDHDNEAVTGEFTVTPR